MVDVHSPNLNCPLEDSNQLLEVGQFLPFQVIGAFGLPRRCGAENRESSRREAVVALLFPPVVRCSRNSTVSYRAPLGIGRATGAIGSDKQYNSRGQKDSLFLLVFCWCFLDCDHLCCVVGAAPLQCAPVRALVRFNASEDDNGMASLSTVCELATT